MMMVSHVELWALLLGASACVKCIVDEMVRGEVWK